MAELLAAELTRRPTEEDEKKKKTLCRLQRAKSLRTPPVYEENGRKDEIFVCGYIRRDVYTKECRLRLKRTRVLLNYEDGRKGAATHSNTLICILICMPLFKNLTGKTMIYGKP